MLRHRGHALPVPDGLIESGPRIQVRFSLHPADLAVLVPGTSAPQPVQGMLLIDTGAPYTFVDMRIPSALGVSPARFQPIAFGDGPPQDRPVYRLLVTIAMEDDAKRAVFGHWSMDCVGMDGSGPDISGLMGRDFLRNLRLKYDGPSGSFEIQSEWDSSEEAKTARRQERFKKKHGKKGEIFPTPRSLGKNSAALKVPLPSPSKP